jgi:hypothetical protein
MTVKNVLDGHILRLNPREQMTKRDIPHFIHIQTLRFQHITKAFQSKDVPSFVLLDIRNW